MLSSPYCTVPQLKTQPISSNSKHIVGILKALNPSQKAKVKRCRKFVNADIQIVNAGPPHLKVLVILYYVTFFIW